MPSGQPPSSHSIIVGNCIICEGLVRVSAKTKASAAVRCPHCHETFSLAALLESAVPEVEVIESESSKNRTAAHPTTASMSAAPTARPSKDDLYIDNTSETNKDAAGKFVVPSQLAKGARRRKSSRRSGSSSSSRSSSGRSETDSSSRESREAREARRNEAARLELNGRSDEHRNGSISASTVSSGESRERVAESSNSSNSHSHRSTRHRDRRVEEGDSEPSPVVVFLKVIAGGALALPIAYLIVMWIFSRDPLGIGERLGETIPFAVPSALRGDSDETPEPKADDDDAPKKFQGDLDSLTPDAIDSGFEDLKIGQEALQDFGN